MIKLNTEGEVNEDISDLSSQMILTLEYKGKTYKDINFFSKILVEIIEKSEFPKEMLRNCMHVELDQSLTRCILFASCNK